MGIVERALRPAELGTIQRQENEIVRSELDRVDSTEQ
jgi:hypothetical protein